MELPTPDWRALDAPPSDPGRSDRPEPPPRAMPRRWLLAAGLALAALALAGGALLAASAPQTRLVLETGPGTTAASSSVDPNLGAPGTGPGPSATPSPSLVVDVEGFRSRRERQLKQLANRMAEQVMKTGKRGSLEPMPSNERRIIHLELRGHPAVTTESTGEEPHRKVVVVPKDS